MYSAIIVYLLLINTNAWSGSFFVIDSGFSSFLILLIFTYLFILLISHSSSIVFLSSLLVLASLLFFSAGSLLSTFFLLEISLVPLLILLLSFGSQVENVSSIYYLILYTLLCSFPFLFIYSLNAELFSLLPFSPFLYCSLFDLVCISLLYLVNFPLYGLHLWLPNVHVESPTESSILLASLLLNMGTYGLTRILMVTSWGTYVFLEFLCLFGLLLSSFICCTSSDSKSLVAYSSIVHIIFLLYLIITLTNLSSCNSTLLIIFHGYTSTMLFYLIGMLYICWSTRLIFLMNSLWSSYLVLSLFILLSFMINVGIPPFSGFFGEVFSFLSIFTYSISAILFLGFYYMLGFYFSLSLGISLLSGNTSNWVASVLVYPILTGYFLLVFSILLLF